MPIQKRFRPSSKAIYPPQSDFVHPDTYISTHKGFCPSKLPIYPPQSDYVHPDTYIFTHKGFCPSKHPIQPPQSDFVHSDTYIFTHKGFCPSKHPIYPPQRDFVCPKTPYTQPEEISSIQKLYLPTEGYFVRQKKRLYTHRTAILCAKTLHTQ